MNKEHTIAVIEPSVDGESTTIELTKEAVARGGEATILVLIGRETMQNVSAFSKSENLDYQDGRAIYFERLAKGYEDLFGARVKLIADGPHSERFVFDAVSREHGTYVVVPQRLVGRRNWKSAVSKSQVPVLLAPPKAA